MLQARMETDKRWYCPDRDLAYIFPKMISQVLRNMIAEDFAGAGKTPEQFGEECKKLARLLNDCQTGAVPPESVDKRYAEIDGEVMRVLSAEFFRYILLAYREWCAYVRPKEPGDVQLSVGEVEESIGKLVGKKSV